MLVFLIMFVSAKAQFVHPGLSHKKSDLDRMKHQVEAKIDPWYSSYQDMCKYATASYNYTVKGNTSLTEVYRNSPFTNKRAFEDDSRAAYYNALRWYIEGDVRHAQKAVECLNAWSGLTKVQSGGTEALTSNMVIIMLEAAELIKYTYSGWAKDDIQKFKDMLVYPGYSDTHIPSDLKTQGTWYWRSYKFDKIRAGNQDLCAIRTCMALGIFLDNEKMFDRAWNYVTKQPGRTDDIPLPAGPHKRVAVKDDQNIYRIDYQVEEYDYEPNFYGNGALTNYVFENGQCQESSRDQGHTSFGLGLLCSIGEIAWNQGYNLWGHSNNRLLLGLEYSLKYNVSFRQKYADQPEPWEPTVESGEFVQRDDATLRTHSLRICPVIDTDTTRLTRGSFYNEDTWELPIAHYVGRGLMPPADALWTIRARDYAIKARGTYEQGPEGGAYVGFGGLSFRRPDGCYGDPINGFILDTIPDYRMNYVPGVVEAENYDYFAISEDGYTYHDNDDINSGNEYRIKDGVDIEICSEGGYNLTSLENGEWLTYTIAIPSTGLYNIAIRYASANANGKIKFSVAGEDITSELTVPFGGDNSAGLTDWKDYSIANDVILKKGVQAIKIHISGESNAFVLNSFEISNGSVSACEGGLENVSVESFITPGINYSYYRGTWDNIPDFSQLTPVESGIKENIGLIESLATENFGMVYSGYIEIPLDGLFTFYTISDEGSRLYIDGNLVVDNDGTHVAAEASGSICLNEGYHKIKVEYFENTGDEELSVLYEGLGITKRNLENLFAIGDCENAAVELPADAVEGISYYYYTGEWTTLPDFDELTEDDRGITSSINLDKASAQDYFGLVFKGYFHVPEDGDYTFYTTSDDGSSLSVDGILVVINDGIHGNKTALGSICLAAGYHELEVAYFENSGGSSLKVEWEANNMARTTFSGLFSKPVAPKENQTVIFPPIPRKYIGEPDFDPGASSSSGLPITYSSYNANIAAIVDNKVRLVGTGATIIIATQQGNVNYNPAQAAAYLYCDPKKDQTISLNNIYKYVGDSDFDPGAVASSGLAVSYASYHTNVATVVDNMLHIVGKGTALIKASQGGNYVYNPTEKVVYLFVEEQVTDIDDALANNIQIFPNPVSDVLNIKIPGGNGAKLDIINLLGVVIISKHIEGESERVNLASMQKGVYIVNISNNGSITNYRIVKK